MQIIPQVSHHKIHIVSHPSSSHFQLHDGAGINGRGHVGTLGEKAAGGSWHARGGGDGGGGGTGRTGDAALAGATTSHAAGIWSSWYDSDSFLIYNYVRTSVNERQVLPTC